MNNLTDEQYLIAIAATYLRVFRFNEKLSSFCKRIGWGPVKQSGIETGRVIPNAEDMKQLRKVDESWKPEPPYGPGNKLEKHY